MPKVLRFDCSTGKSTLDEMTKDEERQHDEDRACGERDYKQRMDDDSVRVSDIDVLKKRASSDPDFAALLRVMKVQ